MATVVAFLRACPILLLYTLNTSLGILQSAYKLLIDIKRVFFVCPLHSILEIKPFILCLKLLDTLTQELDTFFKLY